MQAINLTPAEDAQLIAKRKRKAAYLREWHARPENKGKKAIYAKRVRDKNPEYQKQKARERSRSPKAVAQRKAYRSRPSIRAKLAEYEKSEVRRLAHLKRKYGITAKEKKSIFAAQNNQCLICREKISLTSSHIDHDHITKRIRGLLCQDCNRGLGMFKDNRSYLQAAITYLEMADL